MAEPDAGVRYDRQVRLWGASTQQRLQAATLLLQRGASHLELAKNLVLGGIGRVAVFDSDTVTAHDADVSCTLRLSDVGTPRGPAALNWLAKLNPLVKCTVCGSCDDASAVVDAATAVAPVVQVLADPTPEGLRAAVARLPPGTGSFVVAVVHPCGTPRCTLIFVMYTPSDVDAVMQHGFLQRRAAGYQRAFTAWACASARQAGATEEFPDAVMAAMDARDAHQLAHVSDAEIEAIAQADAGANYRGPQDVLVNSVVGGIVCQQVIGHLASATAGESAAKKGTHFHWALVTVGDDVDGTECVVGRLDEA